MIQFHSVGNFPKLFPKQNTSGGTIIMEKTKTKSNLKFIYIDNNDIIKIERDIRNKDLNRNPVVKQLFENVNDKKGLIIIINDYKISIYYGIDVFDLKVINNDYQLNTKFVKDFEIFKNIVSNFSKIIMDNTDTEDGIEYTFHYELGIDNLDFIISFYVIK